MKKSHRTSRAVFLFCFCCDARSMQATFADLTNANVCFTAQMKAIGRLCSGLDLLSIKCGPFGPNQRFIIITLVNSTGTASTRERAQTITNDLLQFVTVQIQRHLMGITITMNL